MTDKSYTYIGKLETQNRKLSDTTSVISQGGMRRKFSNLTQNNDTAKHLRKTLEREDNEYFETSSNYKVINHTEDSKSVTSSNISKISKTTKMGFASQAAPAQAIIKENYFDEETKFEQIDQPKLDKMISVSETVTEGNIKDDISDNSKIHEDTSVTTSTKVPGKEDRENIYELKVVECLLNNTFIKLSEFTDIIGRKMMFTVDWDYMDRQWKSSHAYLKDKLLEVIFAYSLMDDFIQEENNEFKPTDNPYQFKDTINKMLSDNNILYHLMVESFGIEEDYVDQILQIGYEKLQNNNAEVKNSITDWDDQNWALREQLWSMLESPSKFECEIIWIKGSYHGHMYIFDIEPERYIYFRTSCKYPPKNFRFLEDVFRSWTLTRKEGCVEFLIHLEDINEIVAKNFLLRPHAWEIYERKNNRTYFMNFFSREIRSEVFNILSNLNVNVVDDWSAYFKKMKYEEKWVKSKISSFDYLMLINKYASRSFNDTSQYPIMPWVGPCGCNKIEEFTKSENEAKSTVETVSATNLNNEEMFRDLKKTSGVLGEDKKKLAISKYKAGAQEIEAAIYGNDPYNLKFGYMNTQVCLSYLVRIEPFTSLFINYNGKLDHADRMLSNCIGLWSKVRTSEQCNNELVPEWFYLPQIFTNKNYCDFGIDSTGNSVCDVVLPEWAKNNPFHYWMKFREFIESSRYAKSLHHWIDMVFGKRQQSVEDNNVYFSTSTQRYYEKMNKDEIDPISVESAAQFFHLPKRLFISYHKSLGSKVQNDENEEDKNNANPNNFESVNDVKKEDITISKDEVLNNYSVDKDKYNKTKIYDVLTGNLKNHEQHFHLVKKIYKITPMLWIQKYK